MIRGWTGVLFACAAAVAFWQSSRAAVLWDLTYVLEIAYRINLGLIPYADYVVPQPPLTFVVQAAIQRIFEAGYLWQRLYCAAIAGASAALTFRIVGSLLDDAEDARPVFHALMLAAPSIFLNGYAILPLPFYDPDCAFFVLLALWTLLSARRRGARPWMHVAAGMLFVLPLAAKQNIGLATLAVVHALMLASAVLRGDRSERRRYSFFLLGSISGISILAAILQIWIGLAEYFRWTIVYAAQKRWPSNGLLFSPYLRTGVIVTVACAIGGYLVVRRHRPKWVVPLGLGIVAAPFLIAARTMFRWGLAARAQYVWGLGTFAGGSVAVANCMRERGRFERAVPLLALAVAHAAFASQGLYDSAYAVWPFLAIALVPLVERLARAAQPATFVFTAFVVVMSAGFSWLGFRHIARHERLGFADLSGTVQTASLPPIRGLAVPGRHVADFERLIARCGDLIPPGDGVLPFPGEDPFFLASGRRPRFPIVLFDDTAMPYDGERLLQLLEENEIRWVVVKDQLQLRQRPWRHMESFLTHNLPSRYELVESLPRYRIFRRRPVILAGSGPDRSPAATNDPDRDR
jgi:4-amino-4-deoxy-L-arabinose transferase-like glycosyltransferase